MGALLTGLFADKAVNANLDTAVTAADGGNGLAKLVTEGGLLGTQLTAVGLTLAISLVATVVITLIVKVVVGLRPTPEVEDAGLDISEHGEEGYIL